MSPRLPVIFGLFLAMTASAQFALPEEKMTHSISGQFAAVGSPQSSRFVRSQIVSTNPDFVKLDPALLIISAERIKQALRRELDVRSDSPWRGKVFLVIHPAQSLDDEIAIVSKSVGGVWNYQVQLPDVTIQSRFLRAITSVLLLEIANRNNTSGDRAAEIPAWLTDGFVKQLVAENISKMILSSPEKNMDGLRLARTDTTRHGMDAFADARELLRNHPALTFEQLSWPNAAQLFGEDNGLYRVSAQLFLSRLLDLKDGAEKLRVMLDQLPQFYNWQSAFLNVFKNDFPNPLAVEKWWALQVVNFVAHDPGSQWTPAVSRDKLDEILRIPVAIRASSNALPSRAEVSLQVVIRSFDSQKQMAILQTKLRDLELAQFRMARSLAGLTDGYHRAIADYLGQGKGALVTNKHSKPAKKNSAGETLKRLDDLDAQRREVEATIKPDKSFQPSLAPKKFSLNASP